MSNEQHSIRAQALEAATETADILELTQLLPYVVHADEHEHYAGGYVVLGVSSITERADVEHLLELAATAGWEHLSSEGEPYGWLRFRQIPEAPEEMPLRCDYCHRWIHEIQDHSEAPYGHADTGEPVFNAAASRWGCCAQHLRAAQQETARELYRALSAQEVPHE